MSNIGIKYVLAKKYIFDPNNNSLIDNTLDDTIIRLGSNESRILTLLSEKPNEVITRDQLHEFVWRDQGFQVDDSSLTQAISTLRKMLKDSTKSPQFVKTVPKRGYQLICSVEKAPLTIAQEKTPTNNNATNEPTLATVSSGSQVQLKKSKSEPISKKAPFWTTWSTLTRVLLGVALVLPLIAMFIPNSTPTTFKTVTTVADIPVKTPEWHPDLTSWIPNIKLCVTHYLNTHTDHSELVEVIATANQGHQLYLSYIHNPDVATENRTVRLIGAQKELQHICTPAKEDKK